MTGRKRVTFDAFPDSPFRYLEYDAIACVDIIRATTTLVTAVAQGRRAFPVANPEHAREVASRLSQPLLLGDTEEHPSIAFEMQNSPAVLARRGDIGRPAVVLSSIGTELIVNAGGCRNVYIAALRNLSATADLIARCHSRVAVLAACSRGQLRCEDEMGAAWLIERLMVQGFEPEEMRTCDLVRRWSGADAGLMRLSNSAEYLRKSGQHEDLDFVVDRIDDLDHACVYENGEVTRAVERARPEKDARPQPARLRRTPAFSHDSDSVLPIQAADSRLTLKA